MVSQFKTLAEFYPFYLSQHTKRGTRALHVVGTGLGLMCAGGFLYTFNPYLLIASVVSGYGLAWIAHFFIEKNRPATFRYPLYSFLCDFKMFADVLNGGLDFDKTSK